MAPRPLPGDEPLGEPDDLDSQWADIVARLGDLGHGSGDGAPVAPRPRAPGPPARGDTPGSRTVRPAGGRPADPDPQASAAEDAADLARPPAVDPAGPAAPSGPRSWAPDPDVDEAEDHFDPPDPGPVLGGDPLLTMAWLAVVGVPVLLVVTIVAWRDVPGWVLEVAGAAFVAAVGLLLWRMPHRREPEDDDTGAVV